MEANTLIDKSLHVCLTLLGQKRLKEAERILEQTLKIDPNNTAALNMLGYVKLDRQEDEKVINFLKHALEFEPNCSMTHNNLANCYSNNGDFDQAIKHARLAVDADPKSAILWNTLGIQYKKNAQPEEAIDCFDRSLELENDPYVMTNLGNTYADKLDFSQAMHWCRKALVIRPEISGAHIAIAYCHHAQGEMEAGWREYEYRLGHFAQLMAYMSIMGEEKKWDGKADLSGKRIVVFCEQGYGDAIHFVRYVKELKKLGCHTILNCSEPLSRLMKGIEGVDEICSKDDIFEGRKPEFDYHVPLLSLPLFLKLYDDPLEMPYIHVLNKKTDKFRIGVAWQGSVSHPYDRYRSCSVEFFKQLQFPGVELVSLQKEPHFIPGIVDNIINDFQDTAEIIAGLDLVISVDTSALHLAGAMGKEVWGLLAYRPDFRWRVETEKTIWYPTVRLFRQKKMGEWGNVFEKVEKALLEIIC